MRSIRIISCISNEGKAEEKKKLNKRVLVSVTTVFIVLSRRISVSVRIKFHLIIIILPRINLNKIFFRRTTAYEYN